MVTTYHGVVSGVRSKTGPSGLIMTHFNLTLPNGDTHHVVAMREGRNRCRGAEAVRDGIRAEVTGNWSKPIPGRSPTFFAARLHLTRAADLAAQEPVDTREPSEDLWWDWDKIIEAS